MDNVKRGLFIKEDVFDGRLGDGTGGIPPAPACAPTFTPSLRKKTHAEKMHGHGMGSQIKGGKQKWQIITGALGICGEN